MNKSGRRVDCSPTAVLVGHAVPSRSNFKHMIDCLKVTDRGWLVPISLRNQITNQWSGNQSRM